MKTTILLIVIIVGYVTPTYAQLNRQREMDGTREKAQNKVNYDFRNYKSNQFSDFLSNRDRDILNLSPTRPAPRTSQTNYIQKNNMPCFQPKSGDKMPCFEPTGTFHMRVFKPKDVIWGILW